MKFEDEINGLQVKAFFNWARHVDLIYLIYNLAFNIYLRGLITMIS